MRYQERSNSRSKRELDRLSRAVPKPRNRIERELARIRKEADARATANR